MPTLNSQSGNPAKTRSRNKFLAAAFVLATVVVAIHVSQAQKLSVLHSFRSEFEHPPDGANPWPGVILDSKGNLYGTTFAGGVYGRGTVFEISKTGRETVLYNFCSAPNCTDGAVPVAPLVRDKRGNLYGTTRAGGTGCGAYGGCGTVFKLDARGRETVVYGFSGSPDGEGPYSGLVGDGTGNFYGTTVAGGEFGGGTIFEVSKTGIETVLYSLDGKAEMPFKGLVRNATGSLYGTSPDGFGFGVVFKLDANGAYAELYDFSGGADGGKPLASLVLDSVGSLYGTTQEGGIAGSCGGVGCGLVFKLDMSGKETVLYSFTGGADGSVPVARVLRDGAGNLYGTTEYGGRFGYGTVFKLSKNGRETVLYSFSDGVDGGLPRAGVTRDADGNLYGTTFEGGAFGQGTVFKLIF
jgi:uncharacterized repeat protein (TIGR03803 family)